MSIHQAGSPDFFSTASPQDEYEIIQRIGSGTYGDVYKARHIPTSSMRALKVIKLEAGDDINIIQQEILMMIQCAHPNIIAYFGSYFKRDKLWIAMELCSGGSMQDIYHVYGSLSEEQISFVLRETLTGLDYLHRNGKMHRDIKGANILLTDDGNVKLADFGVAASLTETICKRKSFIGTPYWMAPEVAAVERKGGYNQLCDIWAVGITGIEFAELQPPMFDLHPMRALYLMSKSNFKPPTLKDKNKWSLTFQNFLKYALVINPKKRPSAQKLLEHPFLQGNLTANIARDLLDRLRNGTVNNFSTEDRDDDEDERNDFSAPKKILSSQIPRNDFNGQRPYSEVRAQLNLKPKKSSSASKESNLYENTEDLQRLRAMGLNEEMIRQLSKFPVNAFADLTLNEIQHIVAVMRDADNDENDDQQTIKRQPTSIEAPIYENATLKREKKNSSNSPNGIPNVPRVHMGAGFMKIFNQCPLNIHCSSSWTNNETADQFVLIGSEEGIYSLNLNEIHDATLELLYPRRTNWLFVRDDILWSISGKSNTLHRHDLSLLIQQKNSNRPTSQSNKIHFQQKFEKLIPKKSSISMKIETTRGCLRCCVGRNQFNGFTYFAGMTSNEVFLLQYYDPLRKFMHLKTIPISVPSDVKMFEMLFSAENQFAIVCIGVSQSKSSITSFKFASINFDNEKIENFRDVSLISNVSQLIQHKKDADTILICQGKQITIVNSYGKIRRDRQTVCELHFDAEIRSLVCLQDSVLAFHEHGMQGRTLIDNQITQEVYDPTRSFRVIGSDRLIILESRSIGSTVNSSDLHILMGHENI